MLTVSLFAVSPVTYLTKFTVYKGLQRFSVFIGIEDICIISMYGWRDGTKFTKFTFIHIQCCYCYSRICLFTFNNRI